MTVTAILVGGWLALGLAVVPAAGWLVARGTRRRPTTAHAGYLDTSGAVWTWSATPPSSAPELAGGR